MCQYGGKPEELHSTLSTLPPCDQGSGSKIEGSVKFVWGLTFVFRRDIGMFGEVYLPAVDIKIKCVPKKNQ